MFWAQGHPKETGFHLQAVLPPTSPSPERKGMGKQPQVPWHLFCILVAEYLGVVAVQLEDNPVHLLLTQAPKACEERHVLDQAVTVGLL